MLVEYLGISGSGKSTIAKAVVEEAVCRGIKTQGLHQFIRASNLMDAGNWKKKRSRDASLARRRVTAMWEASVKYPALSANLIQALKNTPRQYSDCALTFLGRFHLSELDHGRLFLWEDEGVLYRGLAAHSVGGDDALFADFLRCALFPDALVFFDVDQITAHERAKTRRKRQAYSELQVYERQLRWMPLLVDAAQKAGVCVVTLGPDDDVEAAVRSVVDVLEERFFAAVE